MHGGAAPSVVSARVMYYFPIGISFYEGMGWRGLGGEEFFFDEVGGGYIAFAEEVEACRSVVVLFTGLTSIEIF